MHIFRLLKQRVPPVGQAVASGGVVHAARARHGEINIRGEFDGAQAWTPCEPSAPLAPVLPTRWSRAHSTHRARRRRRHNTTLHTTRGSAWDYPSARKTVKLPTCAESVLRSISGTIGISICAIGLTVNTDVCAFDVCFNTVNIRNNPSPLQHEFVPTTLKTSEFYLREKKNQRVMIYLCIS